MKSQINDRQGLRKKEWKNPDYLYISFLRRQMVLIRWNAAYIDVPEEHFYHNRTILLSSKQSLTEKMDCAFWKCLEKKKRDDHIYSMPSLVMQKAKCISVKKKTTHGLQQINPLFFPHPWQPNRRLTASPLPFCYLPRFSRNVGWNGNLSSPPMC